MSYILRGTSFNYPDSTIVNVDVHYEDNSIPVDQSLGIVQVIMLGTAWTDSDLLKATCIATEKTVLLPSE